MGYYSKQVFTNRGLEAIARAGAKESKLTFSSIRTGTGTYSNQEIGALVHAVALKEEKQTFPIFGFSARDKTIQIESVISNEGVAEEYSILEIGLFAKEDNGDEFLVAISLSGENPAVVPMFEDVPIEMKISDLIAVSNTENFDVAYKSAAYVSVEEFQRAVDNLAITFPNLSSACTALGISAVNWSTEEFVRLMPCNTCVQFTHNQNDAIKLTDVPVSYATVEFQKGRTVNYCRGSAVHTTSGTLFLYKYESSSSNNGWRKVITDQDSIGAIFLKERMSRPTSANLSAASGERLGTVEYFQASSKMTTGKPKGDGHILQLNWDNNSGYDSQIALINGKENSLMQYRGMSSGVWGDWKTLLDSGNYANYWRPIQNNLTSDSTTASLSAKQGKVLKGYRTWKRIFKNRSGLSTDAALSIASASIFGGDYNEIMILVGTYISDKYWTYPLIVYPGDIGAGDGVCYLAGYYLTPTLYGTACVRVSRTQIILEFVHVGGKNLTSEERTSLTVLYR